MDPGAVGRQLDAAASTVELLPRIAGAADRRTTTWVDSVFRHARTSPRPCRSVPMPSSSAALSRAGKKGVHYALGLLAAGLEAAMASSGASHSQQLRGRVDFVPGFQAPDEVQQHAQRWQQCRLQHHLQPMPTPSKAPACASTWMAWSVPIPWATLPSAKPRAIRPSCEQSTPAAAKRCESPRTSPSSTNETRPGNDSIASWPAGTMPGSRREPYRTMTMPSLLLAWVSPLTLNSGL